MAEQFTKPKIFTKKWFPYFWNYYKVHTVVVVAIVVLAMVTVAEMRGAVQYDAHIGYAAQSFLSEEVRATMLNRAEGVCTDLGKDKEVHADVEELAFVPAVMEDISQYEATENRLLALLADGEYSCFVFDEAMFSHVVNMAAAEELFVPIDNWKKTYQSEDVLYDADGRAVALKIHAVENTELYVAVKDVTMSEEKNVQAFLHNSISVAQALTES